MFFFQFKALFMHMDFNFFTVLKYFFFFLFKALWLPVLGVLSNNCNDIRPTVRERSLETLFLLLRDFGYTFSSDFWKMIISGVLKSLFNELHLAFLGKSTKLQAETENLRSVCHKSFTNLAGLLQCYYAENNNILEDILEIFLKSCISNNEVTNF